MTGYNFLGSLFPKLITIEPTEKTIEIYGEIQSSLQDFNLIDSFFQIIKNVKGEGLALELMFFDSYIINDVVFTQNTVEYITLLIEKINFVSINTSYGQITNEQGQKSEVDSLNLVITAGDEEKGLQYSTQIKRFSELFRIRTNLLKQLYK